MEKVIGCHGSNSNHGSKKSHLDGCIEGLGTISAESRVSGEFTPAKLPSELNFLLSSVDSAIQCDSHSFGRWATARLSSGTSC